MPYADLHLHSTASDGLLPPGELVERARELGFKAIALTDHDTVAGLNEALAAGKKLDVEVIAGVELSAIDERTEGEKEVHILGYMLNYHHRRLRQVLGSISGDRQVRAVRMVEKLNGLGVAIEMERVCELAGGESVGRPHIARAMVEKGYIGEEKEAFGLDFIGRGGRAYVERYKISPREAINLIGEAGGLAVLAHPGYLSDGSVLGETEIEGYFKLGLKGLEVYYSRHSEQQEEYYKGVADKLGLMITGGSDCHGGSKALIGSVRLPYLYVEALKNASS